MQAPHVCIALKIKPATNLSVFEKLNDYIREMHGPYKDEIKEKLRNKIYVAINVSSFNT
jgi:predicted small metal-binding protein